MQAKRLSPMNRPRKLPRVALIAALAGAALVLPGVSRAAPPFLNYQGQILDPNGSPINGGVTIDVGIWNDPNSTDPVADRLYTETHVGVSVIDGVFELQLGIQTAPLGIPTSVFSAGDRWLEVAVNGETLSPRQRFLSVPYSFHAEQCVDAQTLQGLGAGNFLSVSTQTLEDLSCLNGQVSSWDGLSWVCRSAAGLDAGGLVPVSQIPAIAITNVYVVADIAARDALVPEEGDVARVLDSDGNGNPRSYVRDSSSWIATGPLEIAWQSAGSSAFYSAGRVGLGTSAPASPLGIKAEGPEEKFISLHNADDTASWHINQNPSGAPAQGLNFEQQTAAGPRSRLFIQQSSGHVGLGTLVPVRNLHVEDTNPESSTAIRVTNSAASLSSAGWAIGHLHSGSVAEKNGALTFYEEDLAGTESGTERVTILRGGNVGINEPIPDVTLHVTRPVSDPDSIISLVEGTGIMMVGPATQNVTMDFEGIQARAAGPGVVTAATLNLQRLGGEILIHGAGSAGSVVAITSNGELGLGVTDPIEKMELDGAIRIGADSGSPPAPGTIRWTGSDFEGFDGASWASMTAPSAQTLLIAPEFPNAVFSPDGADNGLVVTTDYDTAERTTYYRLDNGTGLPADQDVDLYVVLPVPLDFGSWRTDAISLDVWTDDRLNAIISAEMIDSAGIAEASAPNINPSANSTWESRLLTNPGGTYTRGDTFVLHLKLTLPDAKRMKLGRFKASYDTL